MHKYIIFILLFVTNTFIGATASSLKILGDNILLSIPSGFTVNSRETIDGTSYVRLSYKDNSINIVYNGYENFNKKHESSSETFQHAAYDFKNNLNQMIDYQIKALKSIGIQGKFELLDNVIIDTNYFYWGFICGTHINYSCFILIKNRVLVVQVTSNSSYNSPLKIQKLVKYLINKVISIN
jgi:hypothetical protein